MRIKFKAPDPRAGTVAQMDSSRGQHFIDAGAAVQVKEGEDEQEQEEAAPPVAARPAAKKAAKKSAAKAD